jgi:hypothetical protein
MLWKNQFFFGGFLALLFSKAASKKSFPLNKNVLVGTNGQDLLLEGLGAETS